MLSVSVEPRYSSSPTMSPFGLEYKAKDLAVYNDVAKKYV